MGVFANRGSTYKSLHGTVESVTVVAAELGVDTLERGVTLGLRLLDTVVEGDISGLFFFFFLSSFDFPQRKRRIACRRWSGVIPKDHPTSNIQRHSPFLLPISKTKEKYTHPLR